MNIIQTTITRREKKMRPNEKKWLRKMSQSIIRGENQSREYLIFGYVKCCLTVMYCAAAAAYSQQASALVINLVRTWNSKQKCCESTLRLFLGRNVPARFEFLIAKYEWRLAKMSNRWRREKNKGERVEEEEGGENNGWIEKPHNWTWVRFVPSKLTFFFSIIFFCIWYD